jgi:hypothetical protein
LAILPNWLSLFVNSILSNWGVLVARFTFPSCQVESRHFYFAIVPNCQVHFTMQTAPMGFKLPTIFFIFTLFRAWMFFWSAQKFAQKNRTALFFLFLPLAAHSKLDQTCQVFYFLYLFHIISYVSN